jgi:hypothetical protein
MRSMPDAIRAIVHDAIFIVAHGGALLPCFAARPGACSPRSTGKARFRQRQIALSSCREPVAPCRLPSGRGPSSRHPTVELEPSAHQSDCPAQPSRSRQAGQLPGPGRTRAFRVRGHIEAAQRGYRWSVGGNGSPRAWHIDVSEEQRGQRATLPQKRDSPERRRFPVRQPTAWERLPAATSQHTNAGQRGRNGRYSRFGAKRPAEDTEAARSIVGRRERW